MTEDQWIDDRDELEKAISIKKLDVRTAITLETKLQCREEQKKLEEALRQHKLNYYELVQK